VTETLVRPCWTGFERLRWRPTAPIRRSIGVRARPACCWLDCGVLGGRLGG